MKRKRSKKFVSFFIFTVISAMYICGSLLINAFALGEAEFSIPKTAVSTDENFQIMVSFYATEDIGNVQTSLAYDDSVVEFVSGDNASGGGGLLTVNGFPESPSNEVTFNFVFKGLKSGTASMNLVNCQIYSPDGDLIGSPTAYANITVADNGLVTTAPDNSDSSSSSKTETSAENEDTHNSEDSSSSTDSDTESSQTDDGVMPDKGVLTALTVAPGTLTPEFAYNVYEYTVYVDNSVKSVSVEGTTASNTDYIWYTGSEDCQVGSNVRTITVTDTDGKETTYTITIIRAREGETAYEDTEQSSAVDPESSSDREGSSANRSEDGDAMEKYREILNPALAMILIVLIIALIVIIVWIRGKVKGKK